MKILESFRKRQFAFFTKQGDKKPKNPVTKYIPDFFAGLEGTVLEVGVGAGANLPFYPKHIRLIAIEPNPFMRTYLEEKAKSLGLENVKILDGKTEKIPLDTNSVDFVVSTHVFCSVDDPKSALAEVLRVLKPGGKFLFWEHVGAETRGARFLQQMFNPVNEILYDGCQITRDTLSNIKAAGFSEVLSNRYSTDSGYFYSFVEPHIGGEAVK